MKRSALIPPGSWPRPRRMAADLAADEVTIERLEQAIQLTARCMVNHQLPQILPTLKCLEAERERLLREGDALEYARRLLVA